MMKASLQQFLFVLAAFVLVVVTGYVADAENQQKPAAAAEDISALRFGLQNWNAELLAMIDAGPALLKADEDFGMAEYPANDSAETQAELDYLEMLAKTTRDAKTLELIDVENAAGTPPEIFVNVGLMKQENNSKALELLALTDQEVRYFILREKKRFDRARPTQLRSALTTAIKVPPHPAYPSGHGGQAHMAAMILSMLDEENKDVYMQFGHDVGHRREMAGVHYPSDKRAGRKLAEDVLAKLKEIPAFQKKVQDAKDSFVKPDPEKIQAAKDIIAQTSRPDFEFKASE